MRHPLQQTGRRVVAGLRFDCRPRRSVSLLQLQMMVWSGRLLARAFQVAPGQPGIVVETFSLLSDSLQREIFVVINSFVTAAVCAQLSAGGCRVSLECRLESCRVWGSRVAPEKGWPAAQIGRAHV